MSPEEVDQVAAHVHSRLSGRVHDLRLLLRDDGLVLRGRAHTYHAKQLAQHAVMEAAKLPLVSNEIEVHSAAWSGD